MSALGNYLDRIPLVERLSFRENGAGTYVGTVNLPANAIILDVVAHATALWTAGTSAVLKVGDVTDDDGFFTGVDLKATDLLAGESISLSVTGGQKGADVDAPAAVTVTSAQLTGGESPTEAEANAAQVDIAALAAAGVTANGLHVRRRKLTAARVVKATITSVGAGTAGRTEVYVIYANPKGRVITQS